MDKSSIVQRNILPIYIHPLTGNQLHNCAKEKQSTEMFIEHVKPENSEEES